MSKQMLALAKGVITTLKVPKDSRTSYMIQKVNHKKFAMNPIAVKVIDHYYPELIKSWFTGDKLDRYYEIVKCKLNKSDEEVFKYIKSTVKKSG